MKNVNGICEWGNVFMTQGAWFWRQTSVIYKYALKIKTLAENLYYMRMPSTAKKWYINWFLVELKVSSAKGFVPKLAAYISMI